jgi:hypothetical protein
LEPFGVPIFSFIRTFSDDHARLSPLSFKKSKIGDEMSRVVSLLVLLVISACTGKSDSETLYSAKEEQAFAKFINNKKMPKDPNRTIDKTIINNDYPIEITLYKDHRFHYYLANLGTGKGTWKYSDGKIELRAKRKIFDMYIEVYGSNVNLDKVSIQFLDRFGSKTLKMENQNL